MNPEEKSLNKFSQYVDSLNNPSPFIRTMKGFFELYCKTMFATWCHLKVEGRENLPGGSYIMCSNHSSHMDSGILMVATGKSFTNCGMLAAADYWFESPVLRTFITCLMNLLPLDRRSKEERRTGTNRTIELCQQFISAGNKTLIVYPEGTRTTTGKMGDFKKGVAMFSAQLGIPIVPVHIKGAYKCWGKGSIFMKPGEIRALIGKPIYPENYFFETEERTLEKEKMMEVHEGGASGTNGSSVKGLFKIPGGTAAKNSNGAKILYKRNGRDGVKSMGGTASLTSYYKRNGITNTMEVPVIQRESYDWKSLNGTGGSDNSLEMSPGKTPSEWENLTIQRKEFSPPLQKKNFSLFSEITQALEGRVRELGQVNR